jgi:hypothetical protein
MLLPNPYIQKPLLLFINKSILKFSVGEKPPYTLAISSSLNRSYGWLKAGTSYEDEENYDE